jgi:hypothetical protein
MATDCLQAVLITGVRVSSGRTWCMPGAPRDPSIGGVALGDTPATEQAESDHRASFAAVTTGSPDPAKQIAQNQQKPQQIKAFRRPKNITLVWSTR